MSPARPLARALPAAVAAPLLALAPTTGASASPDTVPVDHDSIAIRGVDRSALRAAPTTPATGVPGDEVVGMTGRIDTDDFRVAGVTWEGDRTDVEAFVRTRDADTGDWTGWSHLASEEGPAAGSPEASSARGGTQPLVAAPSDGIQVRVESTGARPAGLTVDVVDPGTSSADAAGEPAPGPGPLPDQVPGSTDVAPRPVVHGREEWGADESIRRSDPEYGQVNGAVVHHTAGTNTYSKDEVPAILRGIYEFHVNGRGWNDIGYNVLVDKWGRLWEGRHGGLDRAVIGAHATGVNDETVGISALGNYDTTAAPDEMVTGIERFLAWKLGVHDVDPTGRATIGGRWIPTIIGHRGVGETVCPGQFLNARLPEIREDTAARQS